MLEGGRLVEHGAHGELLARGGRCATLYEHQFRADRGGEPAGVA